MHNHAVAKTAVFKAASFALWHCVMISTASAMHMS
jgi:hypothetical protein